MQRGMDPLLDAPHGRRLQAHEQRVHAKITRKPSEYIKKNCRDSEADERLLCGCARRVQRGPRADRLDYPHFDSEYPGTVHELKERADITDKQKQKILCENAKDFLRM
jgi:hypothetical protein